MRDQYIIKVLGLQYFVLYLESIRTDSNKVGLFILFFIFYQNTGIAQLSITTDQTNARYDVGQSMNFLILSNNSENVDYVIKYDNDSPPIESGSISVNAGQAANIPFSLNSPGVVLCQVNSASGGDIAGAVFSPFDIEPIEPEPADFDAFWDARKSELAAVPPSPEINFHESHTYGTSFTLELDNIDGRKIYGYITVPTGPGPFPAIITLPPAGNNNALVQPQSFMAERSGVLAVSLSIHNVPANQEDPDGYLPDDIADPLKNYYRYGVLGAIQTIEYLFTRSDFDGENIGMVGVSQGGGLATMVAGIDQRVNLLAISNPAFGQHLGYQFDKASPYPFYMRQSDLVFGTAAHEAATAAASKYYDAMYFAKRYKGPVLAAVSYEDDVTPAATSFPTINQFQGTKVVVHAKELGHIHPQEYWDGRYDFFRKHYPSTFNAPWPYTPTTTGFFANAGDDKAAPTNAPINLSGSIQKDGSEINLPVEWTVISGPGTVDFSDSNSKNTTATFSENGEYVLSFRAYDDNSMATDAKFFSMSDRIIVSVGSGGDFLTLICPSIITVTALAGENTANVTWADPDVLTTCPGGIADLIQTEGPISNSDFAIGTTTVIYQATDNCGNAESCSFNISVNLFGGGGSGQLSFDANKNNLEVLLEWLSLTNDVTDFYTIERSIDSINFTDLLVVANQSNSAIESYFEVDPFPNPGINFYRLRQTFLDGSEVFSEIKKVDFDIDLNTLSVFPIPTDDFINVSLFPYVGGSGDLQIFNLLGQQMEVVEIDNVPEIPFSVKLENYEVGVYFLMINIKGFKQKMLPFIIGAID